MILIVSDEDDGSTTEVINWLNYFGASYFRINRSSKIEMTHLKIGSDQTVFSLKIAEAFLPNESRTLHSSEITAFWYRRGHLNLAHRLLENRVGEVGKLEHHLTSYLIEENKKIIDFLNRYFKAVKHLNSDFDNETNKLHNLTVASGCGLHVPQSIVTGQKDEFLSFQKAAKCNFITKAIDRGSIYIEKTISMFGHTHLLLEPEIDKMPETFGLSLFQQYVEKLYDLRIFYINGKFFASAILSQTNDKTKTDFRNYDSEKPNRIIRYKLPSEIELKLDRFMKNSDLRSGSIDMVIDKRKEYYFLEVNPIGQYSFISNRCNYQLDKVIAEYLAA